MQDRPIIFSAPMVRAILAGTKTQTRRGVKAPGWAPGAGDYTGRMQIGLSEDRRVGLQAYFEHRETQTWHGVRCPYGQPGDRLWVRETWGYFDPDGTGEDYDNEHETAGPGPAAYCDELLEEGNPLRDFWRRRVAYKATFAEDKYGKGPVGPNKWRPSIHMPRWASRITLEITGVRVERLQDISEADCWCEGISACTVDSTVTGRDLYRVLWEDINGPGSWDANPWVWVLEFRRVEEPAQGGKP